jgi:hypothetical protein
MTEPSSVTYDLTREEYQKGSLQIFLHHLFRRTWFLLVLLFIVFNLLIFLVYRYHPPFVMANAAMATALALLIAGLAWFLRVRTSRIYNSMAEQFRGITWSLEEDGIRYARDENRLKHPWNMFREVYDTGDFLILYRRDLGSYLIPKRVFADRGRAWMDFTRSKVKV